MSQVSDKLKIKGVLCITGVLNCSVLYFSKLKILKTEKVQSSLCSLIPQDSSQWGNGVSDLQCKYLGGS